jgi:hypothetical protein
MIRKLIVLAFLSFALLCLQASAWIVQVQPTNKGGATAPLKTTHGSGWIVQVQPTMGSTQDFSFAFPFAGARGERLQKQKATVRLSL